jgi:hypothetical protein
MRSYRALIAWQKAMMLAEEVHALTPGFPSEERFGLVAQIQKVIRHRTLTTGLWPLATGLWPLSTGHWRGV